MSEDKFENLFSLTTNEPNKCEQEHKFETPEKRGTWEKHLRPSNAEEKAARAIGIRAWHQCGSARDYGECEQTKRKKANKNLLCKKTMTYCYLVLVSRVTF